MRFPALQGISGAVLEADGYAHLPDGTTRYLLLNVVAATGWIFFRAYRFVPEVRAPVPEGPQYIYAGGWNTDIPPDLADGYEQLVAQVRSALSP